MHDRTATVTRLLDAAHVSYTRVTVLGVFIHVFTRSYAQAEHAARLFPKAQYAVTIRRSVDDRRLKPTSASRRTWTHEWQMTAKAEGSEE